MKCLVKTCLILGILSFVFSVQAQEKRIYMPQEIQKAYKKGTRSYDGLPGPNYWQNTVDYKIDVEIDPEEKSIEGKAEAVYYNNSPVPINTLVIRLYYDVFRKGNPRAQSVNPEDVSEGVEISGLKINGEEISLQNNDMVRRRGTNIRIHLSNSIKSGEKVKMETVWAQKIPYTNRRTGVYDSTSFFIGLWYPQFAVMDDIFGWDLIDYSLRTEFYNNLANFDVKISVPSNFLVWATGTLQNPDGVLPKEVFDRYKKAMNSDEVIKIVDDIDLQNGFSTKEGTWYFKASQVSDFAFALSDHYLWYASKLALKDKNVLVSSAFPANEAKEYTNHTNMQKKAMKHFSDDFPGVPYPYEAFTTFIGLNGGGMEYPMMANNDGPGTGLTIHEMYHTYFPMYVRVNERLWAWMDEGWAEYVTSVVYNRYFKDKYDVAANFVEFKDGMEYTMGSIFDLPLITTTESLCNDNHYYSSYSLPAHVYAILHHYLGEDLFLNCYREYINRWAKKSPTPYDFFYTFENVSKQDLSWLWKPWFFEFGVPDLAIKSIKGNKLVIENKGQKPTPVFVDIDYKDSTKKTLEKTAKVWANGNKETLIEVPDYKNINTIFLNKHVADINVADNIYPSLKDRFINTPVSDKIPGRYKANRLTFNFDFVDGVLIMNIEEFDYSLELFPVNSSKLKSVDETKVFEFLFNEAGECIGIKIDWNGFNLEGKKL